MYVLCAGTLASLCPFSCLANSETDVYWCTLTGLQVPLPLASPGVLKGFRRWNCWLWIRRPPCGNIIGAWPWPKILVARCISHIEEIPCHCRLSVLHPCYQRAWGVCPSTAISGIARIDPGRLLYFVLLAMNCCRLQHPASITPYTTTIYSDC